MTALTEWRVALLPPFVAFVVANLVLAAAALYGGFDPLDAQRWGSWDSPIYLDIAQHGYRVWDCPPAELQQGARACGNVGWFPLYPALLAPLIEAGIDAHAAGVLVAMACWLGLLTFLWNGLLRPTCGPSRLAALGLAAFAPGAYYFHGIYPVATAACLLAVVLVLLRRERWAMAGAVGFLAVATYPAAAALVVAAGLWLVAFVRARSWWERAWRILLVCGPAIAGFLAVLLYAHLSTGAWDGYFGVQARFDHGIHLPFGNWWRLVRPSTAGAGGISIFLSIQALFTTALVAIVVISTWRRRRVAAPFDWLVVLYALAFWVIPLCQNTVSYYRTDALLVPIAVAFVRLPGLLVWPLALIGAGTAMGMTLAYMQGVLV